MLHSISNVYTFPRHLLLLVLFIPSLSSYGWESWNVSGFASIGAGKLDREDLTFIDFDNEWGLDSDSVVGIQASSDINDRWTFISQVVANGYAYNDDDAYTPELEWLLFQYRYSPDTQYRFGRIRNPHYFYSNTLEVGYTYTWVRPSVNAYPLFLAPFKHVDGADITYYTSLGGMDLEIQSILGRTSSEYEGSEIDAHYLVGANILAHWNEYSFRFSAQHINVSIKAPSFNQLKQGFIATADNFSAQPDVQDAFQQVVNAFEAKRQPVSYLSIGGAWEKYRWTLMSEVMHFRSADRNFANDTDGYYISASYQWGRVSPYITLGEYHNRFSDDIQEKIDQTENFIPQGADADLDTLRAQTKFAFNQFNAEQETVALGFRYDFHPKADFKFEVEYFNFINGTSGNMYPQDYTQPRPSDALLTSFVIDVVF